jgi:aspartyl-tRNA(Asn)/glutamyl-tRNA(Gln) amidotransferase subunit C
MKVDEALVDRLAQLAKLRFDAEGKKRIMDDLEKMIHFIDKLNEVNTDHVEPLKYITEGEAQLRSDEVQTTISRNEALQNAPVHDSDYFKVPKVIRK